MRQILRKLAQALLARFAADKRVNQTKARKKSRSGDVMALPDEISEYDLLSRDFSPVKSPGMKRYPALEVLKDKKPKMEKKKKKKRLSGASSAVNEKKPRGRPRTKPIVIAPKRPRGRPPKTAAAAQQSSSTPAKKRQKTAQQQSAAERVTSSAALRYVRSSFGGEAVEETLQLGEAVSISSEQFESQSRDELAELTSSDILFERLPEPMDIHDTLYGDALVSEQASAQPQVLYSSTSARALTPAASQRDTSAGALTPAASVRGSGRARRRGNHRGPYRGVSTRTAERGDPLAPEPSTSSDVSQAAATRARRGRGRPRKYPLSRSLPLTAHQPLTSTPDRGALEATTFEAETAEAVTSLAIPLQSDDVDRDQSLASEMFVVTEAASEDGIDGATEATAGSRFLLRCASMASISKLQTSVKCSLRVGV